MQLDVTHTMINDIIGHKYRTSLLQVLELFIELIVGMALRIVSCGSA